jgi:hypothetical protein
MARRGDREGEEDTGFRALGLRLHAGARASDYLAPTAPLCDLGHPPSHQEPVGQRAVAYLETHAPQWLPKITRRRGGSRERLFWQSGGGYDRNIEEPRTLRAMIDYLHLNPVRRGLVARAADWRWSSAGWYEGEPKIDLIPDPIPPEWVAD